MNALEPIHISESQRLIELENTIQRGQKQWLEVGLALTEIKERRLYRADYGTFKAYCQAKWGWSDKRAYQLCAAAEEANVNHGRTFSNERQARAARKERSSPPETSDESAASPGVDADSDESDRSPDAGGEPDRIRTATEELAETSTQEGQEENQNESGDAGTSPAPPTRCDWTSKDFASELDGLMERAEFQIVDSKSASECLLALQISTKLMEKHRNALKSEGK
jgi:hypothetical protein